jgi:hypothetical protein
MGHVVACWIRLCNTAHHVPNSFMIIPYNSVFCVSLAYVDSDDGPG